MGSAPATTRPATAGVLAELRARVVQRVDIAMLLARDEFSRKFETLGTTENRELVAFREVLAWLDELAPITTTPQEPLC